MIWIILILLIAVLGWREVQILIDRGSWKKEKLRFNPYWYIDQNSKKKILGLILIKNLDSFHVANGLTVLMFCIIIVSSNLTYQIYIISQFWTIIVNIGLYWLIWMQLRNLFMKGIYKR